MYGEHTSALINALDGVAYITDREGVILNVGVRNWAEAAHDYGRRAPTADGLIGRNLFDFITQGAVRSTYRALHDAVVEGERSRVTFTCRCDSPDALRQMRMSIGAIRRDGEICGVLYHSQITFEHERPRLDLLTPAEAVKFVRRDVRPIVGICSFCARVRLASDDRWVRPEEYYRRGGESDVRLSHAVCPSCEFQLMNSDGHGSDRPQTGRRIFGHSPVLGPLADDEHA